MPQSNVQRIHQFGQSIWLDFIDRKLMNSGELQQLIATDGIRGLTSNPAIFGKAIAGSTDYDADIKQALATKADDEKLFYNLAVKDIQRAADLFAPLFNETAEGADGFVSLEVSPRHANNTAATIRQAEELWEAINRPNVLIKIPATPAGLPAIRHCISQGINVNVTLIFGLEQYRAVIEAYLAGLEERAEAGVSVSGITCVASFFLSRIDTLVDPQLKQKGLHHLVGEVAIALAKQAYQTYKQVFGGSRFLALKERGAKPQKILWASTGSKDPAFSDVKYVEALIGPDTVNTVPMDTLLAYRHHGSPAARLEEGTEAAAQTLQAVADAGFDLTAIATELEQDGLDKFDKPYATLIATIRSNARGWRERDDG